MFRATLNLCKTACVMLVMLTIITGLIYPAVITGIAQVFFPTAANGSLLADNQGSFLIGQSFTNPKYFWGRPSATTPFPYNSRASRASQLGPTNPAFVTLIAERVAALHQADPHNPALIPVDLVTASGSGLDPNISPKAAMYQVPRIAAIRHLPIDTLKALVRSHIQKRQWGFLGEPSVNVLALNIALDHLTAQK